MKAVLVLALVYAVAVVACGKKVESDDEANGLLIVTPEIVNMAETLTVKVNKPEALRTYYWTFSDVDGLPLSGCDDYTAATISCVFEFPGEVVITLNATRFNGDRIGLGSSVEVIDPSLPSDQAPIIVLKILDDETLISTVATFKSLEAGAIIVPEGASVTFDFSETTDTQDGADALKYEIDFGDGLQLVEKVSTRTFDKVDVYPMRVVVSDQGENTATKSFNVFVKCTEETNYPPVSVDVSKVSISSDPVFNYFNYKVDASAVAGGKGGYPYKFIWDFNGDGTFDSDWLSSYSVRQYSIFGGKRDIGLKVWDTGCNFFKKVTLTEVDPPVEQFDIPWADAIPGNLQRPQIGEDYYFIQAKIAGLEGNDEKSANADYIATWQQGDSPQRVLCDYHKYHTSSFDQDQGSNYASFQIKGLNWYDKFGEVGVRHGMVLKVTEIIDPTGTVGAAAIGPEGYIELAPTGTLKHVNYYTDEFSDEISKRTYAKNDGCEFNMVIRTFPPGPGTCSTNPGFGYPVTFDGTFSCPDLKTADGRHVSATEGAFYCEVAHVDACPPGGGGGGGGLPPTPM